jgi:restriction system protein
MAVPDYQSLMLPLLQCASEGKEVKTADCVNAIANKLKLSEADIEELLPSGKQTLISNRTFWAKSYLTKAGLLESTRRGYIKITSRGLSVLDKNPRRIDNETLSQFPEFLSWQEKSRSSLGNDNIKKTDDEQGIASPEEKMEQAYATLKAQLKAEILESLYSVSPSMFERIIIDLLIAMGYGGGRLEMGKALGKTGDGGVDGVIKEDELGLDVVYIQAKKYKPDSSIGRPDIQAFVGSLEGFNATKGVFVTTSSFANTVHEYVQKIHKRIVLIDGNDLAELMIRHNVGVRIKDVYDLKKLDEDYFVE